MVNAPFDATRAGVVFLLIPAMQRCLNLINRAILHLMARLDQLAFRLAAKVER